MGRTKSPLLRRLIVPISMCELNDVCVTSHERGLPFIWYLALFRRLKSGTESDIEWPPVLGILVIDSQMFNGKSLHVYLSPPRSNPQSSSCLLSLTQPTPLKKTG